MLAIRTVLCPTDFSANSDNAFQMACALARDYAARVIVLHVASVPATPFVNGLVPPPPEIDVEDLRDMLRRYRERDASVAVEILLLKGAPAEEIVEIAKERPCDLIVMGTHGRRGMTRLIMGSVAEAVTRASPCPVLTLRLHPAYLPTEDLVTALAAAD